MNAEELMSALYGLLRNTYQALALFTMGLPSLKRAAYRIARKMVG